MPPALKSLPLILPVRVYRCAAGRMEGSTADIDAGTVKLADGQMESVKLAKPVFVVEPSGRYTEPALI